MRAVVVVEVDLPEDGGLLEVAEAISHAGVPYAVSLHLAIREKCDAVLEVFTE